MTVLKKQACLAIFKDQSKNKNIQYKIIFNKICKTHPRLNKSQEPLYSPSSFKLHISGATNPGVPHFINNSPVPAFTGHLVARPKSTRINFPFLYSCGSNCS